MELFQEELEAEARREAAVQALWLPCDRDIVVHSLGLPEDFLLAPRVPDFHGDHQAFRNWADDLTADQKMLAVARSCHDPLYFTDNWAWFRSLPEAGMWPPGSTPPVGIRQFKLWEPQAHYISESIYWHIIQVIKVRQWGATWIEATDCAREVNFQDEFLGAIISLDKDRAQETLGRVKIVLEHLPAWMKEELRGRPQKTRIELANRSTLKSMATRDTGTVSDAYNKVLVDETALIEQKRRVNLSELLQSSIDESLRMMNGKRRSVTTGRARAGYVWDETKYLHPDLDGNQKERPDDWGDVWLSFIPADAHPVWRDPEVYERELKRAKDRQKFIREHPKTILEAFSPSGVCAFDAESLEMRYKAVQNGYDRRLNLKYPRPRSVSFHVDRRWGNIQVEERPEATEARVYKRPVPGHRYIAAGDPSRGGATRSFCAGIVLDVDTGEVVCVVHHKFRSAPEFTRYMVHVAYYYNTAKLMMEVNIDRSAIKQVLEDEYSNPYYRPRLQDAFAMDEPTDEIGFLTTGKTRTMILGVLKDEIVNDWLIIYDREVLDELYTFVLHVNENTLQEKEMASYGANDDLVMALAMAVYAARMEPDMIESGPSVQDTTGSVGFLDFPADPRSLILPSLDEHLQDVRMHSLEEDPEGLYNWPESTVMEESEDYKFPGPSRYSR